MSLYIYFYDLKFKQKHWKFLRHPSRLGTHQNTWCPF